jgi:CBS domain containing-hemolysin-like protein
LSFDVESEVSVFDAVANSLVLILVTVSLVLLNGVFVAAEFAIVRVRRTRLEELAGQGIPAARSAVVLVDHVSEYLAVTQVAVTAISLGVGWLGEDAFARLFLMLIPVKGGPNVFLHAAAVASAFLLITVLHVVLGELVPKNLAIGKAEHLLLFLARPLQCLHVFLRPILYLLHWLSTAVLRLLGHRDAPQPPLTEEELKLVLAQSHQGGVVSAGEAQIIVRAFEFADKDAEEIMIPAEDVDYISLARPFLKNLEVARNRLHARLPLCRDGLDSVFGTISMKDAWPLFTSVESNAAFEQVARPLIKVRVDSTQEDILRLLQNGRGQMGVVRDFSDSKTLGVVTLEDVLESLVGDVREAKSSGIRYPTNDRPPTLGGPK